MDINVLKNRRSHAKASITRICNWLNANKEIQKNIHQFTAREVNLKNAFENYCSIQDEIEDLIANTLVPVADNEDRLEIEEKYYDANALIQECIKNLLQITAPPVQQTCSTVINNPQTPPASHSVSPNVKLPDITIAPFHGNLAEWQSFFEMFTAVIIDNANLSDIQRFLYLKSYLRGEPLKLVDSLQVTNDNFKIALDILKKRFENTNCIVNSYIGFLLDLPNITKCDRRSLREFVTDCRRNLESLKNLKLSDKQLFEILLIFILQKKLDFGTRRSLEQQRDIAELPTLEKFFEFLEERCVVMENLDSSQVKNNSRTNKTERITLHATQRPKSPPFSSCIYCGASNHRIYLCSKFKSLPISEKSKFVKAKRICFNCLGTKHSAENCNSPHKCNICHKRHHTLLHNNTNFSQINRNGDNQTSSGQILRTNENNSTNMRSSLENCEKEQNTNSLASHSKTQTQQSTINSTSGIALSCAAHSSKNVHVLLATATIAVDSNRGYPIRAKALLDPGSQVSFITARLAEKIDRETYTAFSQISGISQSAITSNKRINVSFLSNAYEQKYFTLSCMILDKITEFLPQVAIDINKLSFPPDIIHNLADPSFYEPSEIDLLLGADIYYSLLSNEIIHLGNSLPTLINTQLGWVIAGNVPIHTKTTRHTSLLTTHSVNLVQTRDFENYKPSVESLLQKFWSLEEIPEKPQVSEEDEIVEKIFISTTTILKDGSYQINVPLKSPTEHLKLGNSLYLAQKRFKNLEKRFEKDNNLRIEYKKFMDEYIELGHGKIVPLLSKKSEIEQKYFIPHLCVIRDESISTKFRVVFDASAKSSSGYSLNDITYKGFQVQPPLYDILCRFRVYKYVLTTDINKMYRRIKVNPNQKFLQNILWRNNPTDSFSCIELQTVTYGTNFAPYVATRVLKDIAENNVETFPLASAALLQQCYMDDILTGTNEIDSLIDLYTQLNSLLNKHDFQLHKWCTNYPDLLKETSTTVACEYDLNFNEIPSQVLGLKWHPLVDQFCISVPYIPTNNLITKRKILSLISQCFDPLGLVNPVVVKGKIIMQSLWCSKVSWDETITDEAILNQWHKFSTCLSLIKNLKIDRHLFTHEVAQKIEIHGFSDASLQAYGACVYMRAIHVDSTVTCKLISSKSKVAPIKTISLPKLELCGMLLLAKLAKNIFEIFKPILKINSVHLWSDSQIALQWCKNHPSKWNVFVANRVSKIQTITSSFSWHYVKSSDNPADLLSRGIFTQEHLDKGFWFKGPHWLRDLDFNSNSMSSQTYAEMEQLATIPEERKVALLTQTKISLIEFWYDIFHRYSSFTKLQRSIAYSFRFMHNLKHKDTRRSDILSVEELNQSLTFIVSILQKRYFSEELRQLSENKPINNNTLLSLKIFLDANGLIRVGGRLENAHISYNQKHPILLPAKDYVVNLLLLLEHRRLGHTGPQTVLSNFRLKYWPLNGLRQIKKIIRQCTVCFRFNAVANQQIMANLPKERVHISRPFQNTGIDLGGPFFIKASKLRKAPLIKCYIALFVCMASKAVHMEVVTGLSTEAFILTLKRFIARRGNPTCIYSDNGTNFTGTAHQLKEIREFFKTQDVSDSVRTYLAQNDIRWKFIPPRSPHWGGLWESAIKSAKSHLLKIVGNARLTYEEFSTILCQVEAVMNSRPLCALSSDPSEFTPLTPGHFLIGTSLTALPEKDISHVSENRLSVYKRIAQIQQIFWKRWSKEYLNRLQNRPKWFKPMRDIQINDLVLLKEDNTLPMSWQLARILEVMPGSDGKVRVVKVKTANSIYIRPVTKICVLPTQEFISTDVLTKNE